jgi:predicted XRE-type DNA-binding protein
MDSSLMKNEKLKQRETVSLLGIPQSEESHLRNGHFSRFFTAKLFKFPRQLYRHLMIRVSPHKSGAPFQKLDFVR